MTPENMCPQASSVRLAMDRLPFSSVDRRHGEAATFGSSVFSANDVIAGSTSNRELWCLRFHQFDGDAVFALTDNRLDIGRRFVPVLLWNGFVNFDGFGGTFFHRNGLRREVHVVGSGWNGILECELASVANIRSGGLACGRIQEHHRGVIVWLAVQADGSFHRADGRCVAASE